MGGKPRVSGGLLDGVNARLAELERRVTQSENLVAKIRLECYEAGLCPNGLRWEHESSQLPDGVSDACCCLRCRLYRMVTEDTPVE